MEHLQTIEKVFSDKLLKVPDYQRGYAWDIKQCNDLVEDLDLIENNQDHYTGTLVIHKSEGRYLVRDEEGSTLQTYDIVDGQQRLTTIVILLNELARELKAIQNKEKLAEGIRKKYITIGDSENIPRNRLTLNSDSDSFFKGSIISSAPSVDGPKIKSHKRLKDAQNYFAEYLTAIKDNSSVDEYAEWLTQLHNKITGDLVLTVYEVPKATDVGIIFEVMNNRGKPLSEMEKVKNYLLYLSSKIKLDAASELGENINHVWSEIFTKLMESSDANTEHENQLLRSHWLMAYNYMPKYWKGYDSVKKEFSLKNYKGRDLELLNKIKTYIYSLRDACIAYCDIISPGSNSFSQLDNKKLKSDIQKHTHKLLRTGSIASFYPLLISIRLKHTMDFDLYLKYLIVAEKYAFRVYRIAKRNSNTGQTVLYRYGSELYHGEDAEQYIYKITNLLLYHAPDNEFALKLELGNMNWYNWTGLKYFLYEYETSLSNGVPVKMSWDDLGKKDTIEHILPQTPDNDYWTKIWDGESIKTHLHDIGNLCITFDNSHYSNKSFPDKKGSPGNGYCYANSSLFMERDLDQINDWTEVECMARRCKIIDWAKKHWHVEPILDSTLVPDNDDAYDDGIEYIDEQCA